MIAQGIAGPLSRALPGVFVHGRDDAYLSFGPWRATADEACVGARVECTSDSNVITVLRVAADAGVGVAVTSGRLDVWARNVRPGDVVINLKQLTGVSYDATAGKLQVGGGAPARSLHAALPPDRVVPVSNTAGVRLAAWQRVAAMVG